MAVEAEDQYTCRVWCARGAQMRNGQWQSRPNRQCGAEYCSSCIHLVAVATALEAHGMRHTSLLFCPRGFNYQRHGSLGRRRRLRHACRRTQATVSKANAQRRLGILPRVARASVLLRGHTVTVLPSSQRKTSGRSV